MTLFSVACASTKPKGKVVRIEKFDGIDGTVQVAVVEEDSSVHKQEEAREIPVPSETEDAAVFYFSLGQAYSLDNDIPRAIEAYRSTLVYDPKSALVHARLAAELVKTGAYQEARELCDKAISLDPKYVDSYLLLAGIQVSSREYEGALQTYKKALAVEPRNRDALLYYGVTLAEVGKTSEGIAQLEKLVKMKDSSESTIDQSVAYYYLAKVQFSSGEKTVAVRSLQEALKRRPGFSKAALMAAEILSDAGQNKRAKEVLEEAFRENHQSDLAERLAEIYLAENKYKEALVYLETLVEEDPSNENMRLKLALVYWQTGMLDKARIVMSDLHERYPASSEITFYMGELEVERKEYDAAVAYFKKISPDYNKYEQSVARAAAIFRNQKRHGEGESFLRESIKKKPDAVSLYPVHAAFLEDQGKLVEAKESLERGKLLFPNEESILYYLGFIYDRLGDKEMGLLTMQKLLSVNPDNPNALNFVGYTLLEKGEKLAQAAKYLERAFQLKPKDPYVLDSYGWLLYKQGKTKQAMVHLEKAYSLKEEEAVIAEHLADVYLALGLKQKALMVYEKILSVEASEEHKARVGIKVQNLREALLGQNDSSSGKALRLPASSH